MSSSSTSGGTNLAEQNRVRIEAHESTNSVVIYGPAELSRELSSIIRQLDIRRAQVLVEAVIAEVSYDRAKELGVQWGIGSEDSGVGIINFNRNGNGIVDLAAGVNAFLEGDVSTPPSLGNGISLGGIGSIGSTQIALLVNALQGDTASNILSTPSLLTLDNEEAEIVVGQNVPFIVGRSVEDSGQAFDTIQREDVGITLKIRPQINEGDAVVLDIQQEVSSVIVGGSVITGASDVVTSERKIQTKVLARDGRVVVLGGLIRENKSEGSSGLPFLHSLPVIGALFGTKSTESDRTELLVVIGIIVILIGLMALQINNRIGHQLARSVVGDFTTAIKPVQRRRGILRIEMQVFEAGAAAERVASGVLQQQQQLRAT